MNIGFFGGTFDPIHNAHVRLAVAFCQELALDEVRLIPSGVPYHRSKQPCANALQRLQMVKLAVAEHSKLSVEDCEIRQMRPSYTVETLRYLRQKIGDKAQLWWLIGSDELLQLSTWWHWEELPQLVNMAVAVRPKFDCAKAPLDKIYQLWQKQVNEPTNAPFGIIRYLKLPPIDISASDIRAQLANGKSVEKLISPAVLDYINQQKLYIN